MHTTNYINTFIEIAEDCPVQSAEIPQQKDDEKTVAVIQFETIYDNPYKFTSDDVIFKVFAIKNKLTGLRIKTERDEFFSKGQPCLRSSPQKSSPIVKNYTINKHIVLSDHPEYLLSPQLQNHQISTIRYHQLVP